MQFTDKELAAFAGWKAFQEGRRLAKTSALVIVKKTDQLVSGQCKIKGRKTLVLFHFMTPEKSKCGCDYHYQTGGICAHHIALALKVREEQKITVAPQKEEENKKQLTGNKSFRVVFTFLNEIKKVASRGRFSCQLTLTEGGKGSVVLREQFLLFLQSLGVVLESGSVILTLRPHHFKELAHYTDQVDFEVKKGSEVLPLSWGSSFTPFPLDLIERAGVDLTLMKGRGEGEASLELLPTQEVLMWWSERDKQLIIIPEGASSSLIRALFAGERVSLTLGEFLLQEAVLEACFSLAAIREALTDRFEYLMPRFELELTGTAHKVEACLRVRYAGAPRAEKIVLTERASPRPLSYDEQSDRFLFSHPSEEQGGLRRLTALGFCREEFKLAGEEAVLEFLVDGYERLLGDGWEITLLGSIRALNSSLIKLEPSVQIDPVEPGDDTFSFAYQFQNAAGKGMKHQEVIRLISSGRQTLRLRSNQIAVLSKRSAELLREAVIDCEARQVGGKFSAPLSQYEYIKYLSKKEGSKFISNDLSKNNKRGIARDFLPFPSELRSYQKDGTAWILRQLSGHHCALLADDMGLGKTVQTLMALARLPSTGERPACILCPASLIENWRQECQRWVPHLSVLVMRGTKRHQLWDRFAQSHIIITSYQTFLADVSRYQRAAVGIVILDEASMIRNARSQLSKAVASLEVPYRLALTGTPVENAAADLWALFRFLRPNYLGTEAHFKERFMKPLAQGGEVARRASLRLKAKVAPFMLRRMKTDVLRELPPKSTHVEYCRLTEGQRRLSAQVLDKYHREKAQLDQSQQRLSMLTVLLRLRQIAIDPRLVNPEEEPGEKVKRLLEVIRGLSGQKILVFSQFSQVLALLAESLQQHEIKYNTLTGATQNRESEIQQFKNEPQQQVFLISLKAGGYGLNLTEASVVIHFDIWWNPAVENQATDRAYRMGQSLPVSVLKFVTASSVEEKILALQKKKQGFIQLMVDDFQTEMQGLATEELAALLEPNKEA